MEGMWKMTLCEIIKDFIVPLISGSLTLIGVLITINNANKKESRNRVASAKPWIFSIDKRENFDNKNVNDIIIGTQNRSNSEYPISFYIKNTDNGIGIIDRVQTSNRIFRTSVGRVLEKNMVAFIHIYPDHGTELKEMFIFIMDIYGNEYRYRIVHNDECNYDSRYCIREEFDNSKALRKEEK